MVGGLDVNAMARRASRTEDGSTKDRDAGRGTGAPKSGRSRGVFVIGCPRSGTSMLAWTLAQHRSFWTSAESDYLSTLFAKGHLLGVYEEAFNRPDRGWLKKEGVSFEEFASMLGIGVEALFESRSGGSAVGRFDPRLHPDCSGVDVQLLPAASFIHIVRDGRAVVNSMVLSGFETNWSSDFATACRTWVHYVSKGRELVRGEPTRAIEVRYEALTASPASELTRIFKFLGEQPSEKAVEFISNKRINSSYGNINPGDIRRVKDPASSPKRPWEEWSVHQKDTFSRIASESMSKFGYIEGGDQHDECT